MLNFIVLILFYFIFLIFLILFIYFILLILYYIYIKNAFITRYVNMNDQYLEVLIIILFLQSHFLLISCIAILFNSYYFNNYLKTFKFLIKHVLCSIVILLILISNNIQFELFFIISRSPLFLFNMSLI